jgi:hypothetical protein
MMAAPLPFRVMPLTLPLDRDPKIKRTVFEATVHISGVLSSVSMRQQVRVTPTCIITE